MGKFGPNAFGIVGLFGNYARAMLILMSILGFVGTVALSNAQCTGSTTCTSTSQNPTCGGNSQCVLEQGSCGSGEVICEVPSGSSSSSGGSSGNIGAITSEIQKVCTEVKTVVFILGLALMILGGALYAGAHVMPGTTKGQIQGYGIGMLMGGVIGVIIALLAPFILNQIISFSNSGVSKVSC